MRKKRIVYGHHAVMAALMHQGENVDQLFVLVGKQNDKLKALLEKARRQGIIGQTMSRVKMDALTEHAVHQGVVAVLREAVVWAVKDCLHWIEKAEKMPLLLILDALQDPHNVGACLRSAQAFGVDWVVLPKMHGAPLNATVSKVACGADFTLKMLIVSNIVRFIEQIQKLGIWVVGTASKGEIFLSHLDLNRPLAFVMGREEKGLKPLALQTCDALAKIPMRESLMDSVNVSVATGICLYECVRQRAAF